MCRQAALNHPVTYVDGGWFYNGRSLTAEAYALVNSRGRYLESSPERGSGFSREIRQAFAPAEIAKVDARLLEDVEPVELCSDVAAIARRIMDRIELYETRLDRYYAAKPGCISATKAEELRGRIAALSWTLKVLENVNPDAF